MKAPTREVKPLISLALKDSELHYRRLFEAAQDGILILDAGTGAIKDVNPFLIDMLGYSRKDFVGKKLWEVGAFKDIEAGLAAFEALQENKTIRYEDLPLKAKDGRLIQVQFVSHLYLVGDEKVIQCDIHDITARKQAEETLRQTHEALQALIQASPISIVTLDPDGKVKQWNPASERIFGWSEAEVLGQFLAYVPKDKLDENRALRQRVLEGESFIDIEVRRQKKDGSVVFISLSTAPIHDVNGNITGIMGINVDITERKQAEEALQESEKRFRALVENSSDAITMLDAKGIALYDSPAAPGMLGYASEDWIGQNVFALIHPDDLLRVQVLFQNVGETPRARVNSTFRVRHKSGWWLWIEMSATNLLGEPGVQAIVLNYRDITARKQAEKTISRLAAIVESSDEAIIGLTLDGDVDSWNLAAQRLYGYAADEILGRPFISLLPGQAGEGVKILERLKSGEHIGHFETIRRRKDGQSMHVSAAMSVIRNAGNQIVGLSSIERDIGQQKRAEDVLHKLGSYEKSRQRTNISLELIAILIFSLLGFLLANYFVSFEAFRQALGEQNGTLLDIFLIMSLFAVFGLAVFSYRRWLESRSNSAGRQQAQEALRTLHGELEMRVQERTADLAQTNEALKIEISYRKLGEAALSESEEHYRQIIETAQEGIWTLDAANQTTLANQHLADMLGYTIEEMMGKSVYEFMDDEGKAIAATSLENRRQGINEQFDFKYKRKDGSAMWALIETSSLQDRDGNYVGALAMLTDITKRRQAEAALQESEQHYRQIFETAGEGIWVINADNRTTLANKGLAKMLGYSVEELLDKSIFDFIDEEQVASAAANLAQREQGTNNQLDLKITRKDGSALWALIEISVLQDQHGIYTGALAMLTDITQRRQAEEAIRQRLNELAVLYQSSLAFSQLMIPKAIAEKIIELLDQEMDWHHTAIRLYHPETEILELLAFNLPHLNSPEERRLAEERFKIIQRPDQGLSGWVIQHGEVIRSNDLKNDPHYVESFPGLQSGLYVPIKIAERVLGVITIESEQAEAFNESDERLVVTLATQAAIAMDNAQLFKSLNRSNTDLTSAYDATIEGWSSALDLRDQETEGHSQRVTELTLSLARSMGLSEEELVHVRRGALLHDIGKMGIPDGILHKPGPLTDEEWVVMKKHPTFAYEMLYPIRYLRLALDLPYCHHEKWDGSGYPRGLKGKQIPLTARIFAVVDVWDALSSDRPYRAAWKKEKVREHIRALSGTHFDPQVVDAFMQILNQVKEK